MTRQQKPRSADYLLIDVSNSFTKFAFSSASRLGRTDRIPTRSLTSAAVARIIRARRPARIVVSSVVPKKTRAIKKAAGNIDSLWVSSKVKLGVAIQYPRPESIGADRLANAAAVVALYGYPAVVVDFGTAVTFDVISQKRSYIGGVIAPGLEAMTSFLHHRTALLPKISLKEPRSAVGKSTVGAMQAGAVFGYRGLIREILERIAEGEFSGERFHVIATGGYAKLIASNLREIDSVHDHLTLEGLRIIGNLNAASV